MPFVECPMDEPGITGPDRVERERVFHNLRYENDSARRRKVSRFYRVAGPAQRHYQEVVLEFAKRGRALELGCGVGKVAIELAKAGESVTGIDVSDSAISQARELARSLGVSVDLRRMNAEEMDFSDSSFDLVYGSGILHHLSLARAVSGICRVLKPNGRVVFLEPLGHNPMINLYRWLTPELRSEDEHPLREADLDFIRSRFARLSLDHYCCLSIAGAFLQWVPGKGRLQRVLEGLDQLLFRWPWSRRLAWIVLITGEQPARMV
jgi:SAM-dependent methyltransferase